MNEIRRILSQIGQQKHLCRLDFFEQSIFFTKYTENGKIQYEVSADDIEQLFSGVEFSTGVLPQDTIFYSKKSNIETLIIFKKGGNKTIFFNNKEINIVIPDHIFYGKGLEYRIFAIDNNCILYHMPLPNIYDKDGKICQGDVPFTKCSSKSINQNYETFWNSGFNEDLSEGRIKGNIKLKDFLLSLKNKKVFPKKKLLRCGITLNDLMGGKKCYYSI